MSRYTWTLLGGEPAVSWEEQEGVTLTRWATEFEVELRAEVKRMREAIACEVEAMKLPWPHFYQQAVADGIRDRSLPSTQSRLSATNPQEDR